MKTPKLVKIDLMKCFSHDNSKGSYHDHPDISPRNRYLAKIDGEYHAGQFSRVWYGWSFDGGPWGDELQLDKPGTNGSDWQGLWKIV